jgi:hypothetical protein
MSLRAALRGEVLPTVASSPTPFNASNPLALICFSADPRGRGLVFDMKKAIGVGIILCAIGFGAWAALKGRRPKGKEAAS